MKDIKKGIGYFFIAVVAIIAGVFCVAVGSVPDWLAVISSALGGLFAALGIYWVNPITKEDKKAETSRKLGSIPTSETYEKSIREGREKLEGKEGGSF